MDGVYFLVIWIGSAALHTVYELKLKPRLATYRKSRV